METTLTRRGFLPSEDPLVRFGDASGLAVLDTLGEDLPSLLLDPGFRTYARELRIPPLPERGLSGPQVRLYYVRLGFLASAYVNQVGQEPVRVLPRNIAGPLCAACERLRRPPILSYDGYALYNWKRFDPAGPIALGNIDTIQDFVHLYDEHWFILVHVEIEALAAGILAAIARVERALPHGDVEEINASVAQIARTVWSMTAVLRRIPERMDPALYYKTFRPYIRFFEGVVYEGKDEAPLNFRGETGAQSSVVPTLAAFFKIPHRPTLLTDHLADMRRFMPAEHRAVIAEVEALPTIRGVAEKALYNEALEALATFREAHLDFAERYVARWVSDPRGTGGTPFLRWLAQLIEETRAHKIA
jgi:indoleamine 2,3-dioxygenase